MREKSSHPRRETKDGEIKTRRCQLISDAMKKSHIFVMGEKKHGALFKQTETLGSVESRRDEKIPHLCDGGKKARSFI